MSRHHRADPELFPAPARRLSRELHAEVFGGLPSRLGHDLDEPAVTELVTGLLVRGWRPAQLADRVGALHACDDPALAVRGLLRRLGEEPTPQERVEQDRSRRADQVPRRPPPASPEVKARYLAQIRSELGLPTRPRPAPVAPSRPPCALCGGVSGYFVTHRVRLCESCVEVLESGQARLVAAG